MGDLGQRNDPELPKGLRPDAGGVGPLRAGRITLEEALQRYQLTEEEPAADPAFAHLFGGQRNRGYSSVVWPDHPLPIRAPSVPIRRRAPPCRDAKRRSRRDRTA